MEIENSQRLKLADFGSSAIWVEVDIDLDQGFHVINPDFNHVLMHEKT